MQERLVELLGINDLEAKIYLTLLKHGPSTILDLAEETGIARSSIYNYLGGLKELGLITEQDKNNKHYLTASSPVSFDGILDKKEKDIQKNRHQLEKFLPELLKAHNKSNGRVKVAIYDNLVTVRNLYKEAINTSDKIIRMIYSVDKMRENVPDEERTAFTQNRLKAGVTARTIYNSSKPLELKDKDQKYLRRSKWISQDKVSFNFDLLLYDDVVAFINYDGEKHRPLAVVTKSQAMANSWKTVFDFMFEMA